VSLVTETGIQFCPWCGCNLKQYYLRYIGELKYEPESGS
jgi:hypothetical protein